MSEAVKYHHACELCGSSDAATTYDDGHTFCYACMQSARTKGEQMAEDDKILKELDAERKGKVRDIPDRGITKETCAKYGVRTIRKGGQIIQHVYPYCDKDGTVIAEKTREVQTKQFFSSGRMNQACLFGQHLFPSNGKYITVTEGEIDCLSVYQMFGGKYPVVSIPNGATSKRAVLQAYEYLNGFENIVLCWDGDKAGKDAVRKIAELLPPKKVRIVKLNEDMKDPNEFLKAGKQDAFINLWWRAEEFRPEDIVNIGDMFDRLANYRASHCYTPTPWSGLNDKIVGTRAGQLVVLASGTGMGKSAFLKSWMYHLLKTTEDKIGALYLEEVVEETVISLMSLAIGANLKKPHVWDKCNKEQLEEAFTSCGAGRRVELFEPLSNTEPDYVIGKIRYMAKARDCKVIFLDHLTYVVDDSDNVRTALNKLCKGIHDLCVELGLTVICACHLRKANNGNKTHEEGGRVTLDDLKDSSSIKQLCDVAIGLERDSQNEDEGKANTTVLRVLKNRDFGEKGASAALVYDKETTRLTEISLDSLNDDDIMN